MSAAHGVTHATIRATDEDDVLHVECRFDDGQKYAAIEVSGHRCEELAALVLGALNPGPTDPQVVALDRGLIESAMQLLYSASNGNENIFADVADEFRAALSAFKEADNG